MKIYFQILPRSFLKKKKKKNQTLNDQSDQSILDVLNAVTNLKDFSEMQNEGEKKKENWTCASD